MDGGPEGPRLTYAAGEGTVEGRDRRLESGTFLFKKKERKKKVWVCWVFFNYNMIELNV